MSSDLKAKAESLLNDARKAYKEKRLDEAVRMSGEALAAANDLWDSGFNSRTLTEEVNSLYAVIGTEHCRMLISAGMDSDAQATASGLLYKLSLTKLYEKIDVNLRLELWLIAYTRFINHLSSKKISPEADIREHVANIACLLYTMLYHTYREAIGKGNDNPILLPAYEALLEGRGNIPCQSERIMVSGEIVNPKNPLPLLADLLGRMKAIGMFEE